MTKLLKGLYVVGVAAVLAASATSTQAADLRCEVPFRFTVNGRTLPPGRYDVSISQGVVKVRGVHDGAFALGNRVESTTDAAAKLVFHRFGDDYVLYEAWAGGYGRQFPRSRQDDARRREASASVERVEVPLL